MLAVVALLAAASAFTIPEPKAGGVNWAVIIAGSNTWENYRHQADVCHSYQVLKSQGLPDERIIVFMYDDIANNSANPTPGVIINQPGGPNVYTGVPQDYTGEDVTPQNFISVLLGQNPGVGSGKVLSSNSNDNVFIFFDDHGGPGIIAFPSTLMTSQQLISTLLYMHGNNSYNELVFYMEACESGSMFHKLLPKNINIYATTAADPTHSSYACYYDATLGTYLGDVYSVNWMQDSEVEDLSTTTLKQQYLLVKNQTNTSIVCNYGDMGVSKNDVEDFFGNAPVIARKQQQNNYPKPPHPTLDAVDSREVKMFILKNKLAAATTQQQIDLLQSQIDALAKLEASTRATYKSIITALTGSEEAAEEVFSYHDEPTNAYCIDIVMPTFHNNCFSMSQNDYALKYAYVLSNMCMKGTPADLIAQTIIATCAARIQA